MIRRMITRFGVGGGTLVLSGFRAAASPVFYCAASLFGVSLRPAGILASLFIPVAIAPPPFLVLLRISRSPDNARLDLLKAREVLENRVAGQAETFPGGSEDEGRGRDLSIDTLPENMARRLRETAIDGDFDYVLDLAAGIEESHRDLAGGLEVPAERLNFRRLPQLIDRRSDI